MPRQTKFYYLLQEELTSIALFDFQKKCNKIGSFHVNNDICPFRQKRSG